MTANRVAKLSLCYLAPFVPDHRADNAGASFFASYVESLANDFLVTVITTSDAVATVPAAGVEVISVPKAAPLLPPPVRRGWNALVAPTPGLAVGRRLLATPLVAAALRDADVVEVGWSAFLPLVPRVRACAPHAVIAAFEHDVLAQAVVRRRHAGSRLLRLSAALTATSTTARERFFLNKADCVVVFSEKDRELLRSMGVGVPIAVVPPRVTFPPLPSRLSPATVLFTGAMWRWENAEGIERFIDESWAQIRAAVPDAKLVIAGSRPPPTLVGRRDPSVVVTGEVGDLAPYYSAASVFVAPLWSGAGVKFKVAQAIAYGLPVVATPTAAEGIAEGVQDSVFWAVASDSSALADATIAALRSPEASSKRGLAGRRWLQEHWDYDASVRALMSLYKTLVAERRTHSLTRGE